MGLVLAFQSTPRPAAPTSQKRGEPPPSADILFFTGVRYERAADSASQPAARPSGAQDDVSPSS